MRGMWYGSYKEFDNGATDEEILEQLPGKFMNALAELKEGTKEDGRIDMKTLTIIFKSAEANSEQATIGVKAEVVLRKRNH